MVDTLDSKSNAGNSVPVQVRPPVPHKIKKPRWLISGAFLLPGAIPQQQNDYLVIHDFILNPYLQVYITSLLLQQKTSLHDSKTNRRYCRRQDSYRPY